MDINQQLSIFKKATATLNKEVLHKKQLLCITGSWLNSVVLKMQKKHWANTPGAGPQAGPGIFFSVWLNEQTIKEEKVYYNIHALKLRQLNGYKITSRDFAAGFRKAFKKFEKQWPNVSTDFGPLTLMEGWIDFNEATLQKDISKLAEQFATIDDLIDDLLNKYKDI